MASFFWATLYLVFDWLVAMRTYLYYFTLLLYRTRLPTGYMNDLYSSSKQGRRNFQKVVRLKIRQIREEMAL